jgi:hypothetical protein
MSPHQVRRISLVHQAARRTGEADQVARAAVARPTDSIISTTKPSYLGGRSDANPSSSVDLAIPKCRAT